MLRSLFESSYYSKIFFWTLLLEGQATIWEHTLTDPNASCPRSLLKTTPPPPGCPWVPGGPEVTPEPSFRGLVLDHQVWKQPEAKNLSKTAKFDQKQQFLSVFLDLASLKLDGRAPNP